MGTFDNGATTEHGRFLGRVFEAQKDEADRRALEAGIEYVLRPQFPNGCWPEVYPLVGGYHDVPLPTTTTPRCASWPCCRRSIEPVARGCRRISGRGREAGPGARCCVPAREPGRGGRPARRSGPRSTTPLTRRPVKARAYEHASLEWPGERGHPPRSSMALPSPDAKVTAAVRAAAAWFHQNAYRGFAYEGRELKPTPGGAGPLWARFYEIGTNRPIFSNRDGIVRYRWEELGGAPARVRLVHRRAGEGAPHVRGLGHLMALSSIARSRPALPLFALLLWGRRYCTFLKQSPRSAEVPKVTHEREEVLC